LRGANLCGLGEATSIDSRTAELANANAKLARRAKGV